MYPFSYTFTPADLSSLTEEDAVSPFPVRLGLSLNSASRLEVTYFR